VRRGASVGDAGATELHGERAGHPVGQRHERGLPGVAGIRVVDEALPRGRCRIADGPALDADDGSCHAADAWPGKEVLGDLREATGVTVPTRDDGGNARVGEPLAEADAAAVEGQ